jgi:hypothetical protein
MRVTVDDIGLLVPRAKTDWRRQREAGALKALAPRQRGRKAKGSAPEQARLLELECENAQLRNRLA